MVDIHGEMPKSPEQMQAEQDAAVKSSLGKIKNKLIVMSGKGGVGKTSSSVNLAIALAGKGHKVGIMDVDLHGPDVPRMLGLSGMPELNQNKKLNPMRFSENLTAISIESFTPGKDDAIIWRGPLKFSAIRQFIADVDWGNLDFLVIDLQEVGTRVYTFGTTLALCLEAARDHDLTVVVLDRPNPTGGHKMEGNILEPGRRSFVGHFPIPMRHGLTFAEMALLFNEGFGIGAPLEVFIMDGWSRNMLYHQTGLHWVPPSPNLPTPESTMVYPGQVILEGTNLSEGRGTTTPFQIWGSPYLNPKQVLARVANQELTGLVMRPAHFKPTFDKWAGQSCSGFQLHVTDSETYRPLATSLTLVQAVLKTHPEEFTWSLPPYEYELEHLPIEIILGSATLHRE